MYGADAPPVSADHLASYPGLLVIRFHKVNIKKGLLSRPLQESMESWNEMAGNEVFFSLIEEEGFFLLAPLF